MPALRLRLVVDVVEPLPDRGTAMEASIEQFRDFTVAMRVVPDGPLVGQTIESAGMRAL